MRLRGWRLALLLVGLAVVLFGPCAPAIMTDLAPTPTAETGGSGD